MTKGNLLPLEHLHPGRWSTVRGSTRRIALVALTLLAFCATGSLSAHASCPLGDVACQADEAIEAGGDLVDDTVDAIETPLDDTLEPVIDEVHDLVQELPGDAPIDLPDPIGGGGGGGGHDGGPPIGDQPPDVAGPGGRGTPGGPTPDGVRIADPPATTISVATGTAPLVVRTKGPGPPSVTLSGAWRAASRSCWPSSDSPWPSSGSRTGSTGPTRGSRSPRSSRTSWSSDEPPTSRPLDRPRGASCRSPSVLATSSASDWTRRRGHRLHAGSRWRENGRGLRLDRDLRRPRPGVRHDRPTRRSRRGPGDAGDAPHRRPLPRHGDRADGRDPRLPSCSCRTSTSSG